MFGSKGLPIGNSIWAIEWSRDRWRHERSNSWPHFA